MRLTEYARTLNRGKSIEYSKWDKLVYYTNDCFKQDLVSRNNALFACLKSHTSDLDNAPDVLYKDVNGIKEPVAKNPEYWELVMVFENAGEGGNGDGAVYIPEYDFDTNMLSWTPVYNPDNLDPIRMNIDTMLSNYRREFNDDFNNDFLIK